MDNQPVQVRSWGSGCSGRRSVDGESHVEVAGANETRIPPDAVRDGGIVVTARKRLACYLTGRSGVTMLAQCLVAQRSEDIRR